MPHVHTWHPTTRKCQATGCTARLATLAGTPTVLVRTTSGALTPAPPCGHTSKAATSPNGACAICTTKAMAHAAATHPPTCICGWCPYKPTLTQAALYNH